MKLKWMLGYKISVYFHETLKQPGKITPLAGRGRVWGIQTTSGVTLNIGKIYNFLRAWGIITIQRSKLYVEYGYGLDPRFG